MRVLFSKIPLGDLALPCEEEMKIFPAHLNTGDGETIHVFGPCSSTLDVAWDFIASGNLDVWDSVIAASQWAGRGQIRRTWVSPAGNLYAAWRWPLPPKGWETLVPLMAGSLVHDFFLGLGIFLHIKWPNDLLLEGRKVGGILVEERKRMLVVGMGINILASPAPDTMRPETSIPAGNLSQCLDDTNAVSLWAQLVSQGCFWYKKMFVSQTPRVTPSVFAASIEPYLAFLHQSVQVVRGDERYTARVAGLRKDGGLVLHHKGRRDVLYSGSIFPLEWGERHNTTTS